VRVRPVAATSDTNKESLSRNRRTLFLGSERRHRRGDAVHSAAHRSFTVVTVMTLIFTPMLKGHHWMNVLTGKTTEKTIVQCQAGDPCPATIHIKKKLVLPHP
jgi:hypothetical protein